MNFNDYADSYNSDLIDQKAIYKLFTSKRDFFFEYKFDILVRHIKTSPQNILDFGCGVGLCLPYLKNIFPKKSWNKLHLQIIWYGREYCRARECYGISCKICKSCYPNRKKSIKTKKA